MEEVARITHEDNMFYRFIDSNLINLVSEGSIKLEDRRLHYVVIPCLSRFPNLYQKFQNYISNVYNIDCFDDFPKETNLDKSIRQYIHVETKEIIDNKNYDRSSTYAVYYI